MNAAVHDLRATLDREAGIYSAYNSSLRNGADNAPPLDEPIAPTRPLWPEPLTTDSFHGLAGEIVLKIDPHTEADPAAILLQTLIAFGSAVGRGPHLRIEGDEHGTNNNVVLVGRTAKGRKGTSWGRVREVFALAEPVWTGQRIVSGLSSGEGLIWQVRDPILKLERDRRSGVTEEVLVDAGVSDKRLLVQESEFASVLRQTARQGNILSVVIRDAWDRGDLSTLTKNSPARATGACISIIGHVTDEELRRDLDRTEAANGFANRFLFVCVRRSKMLPEGGGEIDWADLPARLGRAIIQARGIGQVGRTARMRMAWRDVYEQLSEGRPGLLGAVTGRAEAHVMRLALLYALLDGQASVDEPHLRAALACWRYAEASARYVFGENLGDPVADELLRGLRQTPAGLTRTDLSALLGRHTDASQITRALAALADQGLALSTMESTGGRPRERWRAAPPLRTPA